MLRQGRTSSLEADIWYLPEKGQERVDALYLTGPYCERGRTLTARYPFRKTQLADREAWKVTIPEPSLWTPRTPTYYKLAESDEIIGLRDLRIRGDSFFLADRRWVIRAAWDTQSSYSQTWAEADLIPLRGDFIEASYEAAILGGLPLLLRAEEPTAKLVSAVSCAAAALMLSLPYDCSEAIRQAAHSHILLGTHLAADLSIPAWAQFVSVTEDLLYAGWRPKRQIPVVATRQCDVENYSPVALRQMCDQFQADLDHGADYAGLWLLPKTS